MRISDRSSDVCSSDLLSQEIRLASPTGGAFDYQVGGYFLREKIDSNNRSRFQKDATTYFLSPLLPASVLDGVEYDQFGRARITSYAAFGQASWHVTDRATLTGGLRYTIETKEASNTGSSLGGETRSEEQTSELPSLMRHSYAV